MAPATALFVLYLVFQFPAPSRAIDFTSVGTFPSKADCIAAQKVADLPVAHLNERKYFACISADAVNAMAVKMMSDTTE